MSIIRDQNLFQICALVFVNISSPSHSLPHVFLCSPFLNRAGDDRRRQDKNTLKIFFKKKDCISWTKKMDDIYGHKRNRTNNKFSAYLSTSPNTIRMKGLYERFS